MAGFALFYFPDRRTEEPTMADLDTRSSAPLPCSHAMGLRVVGPEPVFKRRKVLDAQQRSGEHLAIIIRPERPCRERIGKTFAFKKVDETEGWMAFIRDAVQSMSLPEAVHCRAATVPTALYVAVRQHRWWVHGQHRGEPPSVIRIIAGDMRRSW